MKRPEPFKWEHDAYNNNYNGCRLTGYTSLEAAGGKIDVLFIGEDIPKENTIAIYEEGVRCD
jgi:hypothetical protein